jgi:amidase
MMTSLVSTEPWLYDPDLIKIPWRQAEEYDQNETQQLCFGVMPTDGKVTPHPPIQRGIKMVTEAVKAAGHKVSKTSSRDSI